MLTNLAEPARLASLHLVLLAAASPCSHILRSGQPATSLRFARVAFASSRCSFAAGLLFSARLELHSHPLAVAPPFWKWKLKCLCTAFGLLAALPRPRASASVASIGLVPRPRFASRLDFLRLFEPPVATFGLVFVLRPGKLSAPTKYLPK